MSESASRIKKIEFVTVPMPIAVGMSKEGMITLEYMPMEENKAMARNVAVLMFSDEREPPAEVAAP